MITLLLYESALELIPSHLRNHPLIQKEWKTTVRKKDRGIILDNTAHRPLMKSLEDKQKRGRPDIVHIFLLSVCYSPLVKSGEVQVLVHTRNDLCISVSPVWRIPVNQNRFYGLLAQLLLHGRVPLSGEPILSVQSRSISQLLDSFGKVPVFLCENNVNHHKISQFITDLKEIQNPSSGVFLIGGFQRGEPNLYSSIPDRTWTRIKGLKLYDDAKPAWTIGAKIIHWLEGSNYL
ncbi:MAG: 16S rRNA methyltransferase [Candidatus Heimdallarchaeota archaeon]